MNLHSHIPDPTVALAGDDLPPDGEATVWIDLKGCQPWKLNPSAMDFFGTGTEGKGGLALSMPAWDAVRDFALSSSQPLSKTLPLLFWTPRGPAVHLAQLSFDEAGGVRSVRLRIFTAQAALESPSSPPVDTPEKPEIQSPSNDMETLREIARRIRAGTTVRQSAGASTAQPDLPPPLDFQPVKATDARPRVQQTEAPGALSKDGLSKLVHELRTPLSAIVSLAEVMRDERLGAMGNDRYKAYAADIFDSAQHTLDLVTTAMEAAESAVGDPDRQGARLLQPMNFVAADLDEIARSCVSSMQPIAARGGVKIELSAGKVPLVQADRRAVRQMLLNILSNAIRFTPSDGNIKVISALAATGEVTVTVADTGSGMRSADLVRALSRSDPHPVQPLPPRIRIAGGHHGIGLPLVRDLIEAHGGHFDIDSHPGSGTRVTLTFPAERVAAR